jgi:hypothetical protein
LGILLIYMPVADTKIHWVGAAPHSKTTDIPIANLAPVAGVVYNKSDRQPWI